MSLIDQNGREIAPDTGNGVTPITAKQFDRHMKQNATVGEVHEIARAYMIDGMEHFGRQVPDLVAKMIVDFFVAQGLAVRPPDSNTTPAEVTESPVAEVEVSENTAKYPPDPSVVEGSIDTIATLNRDIL